MPNYEYKLEANKKGLNSISKKKQISLLSLLSIGALAFYLWTKLNKMKKEARENILEQLQIIPVVSVDSFSEEVKEIWWYEGSWDKYLDSLYLPYQIKDFKKNMLKIVEEKRKEIEDEPRKKRQEELKEAKKFLEPEEKDLPEFQDLLKNLEIKVNNTPIHELSSVSEKFMKIVLQERAKRKRLYWLLTTYNWADRWLARNAQSFNDAWQEMNKDSKEEASCFDAKAIYKISFSSSLWDDLTEEQKKLAKLNGHDKLKIKEEARDYHFSPLIEEWKERVVSNPVRGEYKPNENILDNNALFYGAPRTGKSIMTELVADEANELPLVIIQGSSLTPNKYQIDTLRLTPLLKFIYTICSINYDLVHNFGLQRAEDGEVRYILFLDEADQVATTHLLPPSQASSQLTFLKECMGSDNKSEESKNLWIAATNHLDSINIAIYQSGRLSNPLDFSWTLAVFNDYASDAKINHQFPDHWIEEPTLSPEDNKWVNKFNKIIFDKDFLPFWQKFINHSETQTALKQEVEWKNNPTTNQSEKIIKKKGIQWGEFFEFFWQLYDSKQLESFNGKWRKPHKPTIEEVVEENLKLTANKIGEDISKSIDTRLKELNETANNTKNAIDNTNNNLNSTITRFIDRIDIILTAINK